MKTNPAAVVMSEYASTSPSKASSSLSHVDQLRSASKKALKVATALVDSNVVNAHSFFDRLARENSDREDGEEGVVLRRSPRSLPARSPRGTLKTERFNQLMQENFDASIALDRAVQSVATLVAKERETVPGTVLKELEMCFSKERGELISRISNLEARCAKHAEEMGKVAAAEQRATALRNKVTRDNRLLKQRLENISKEILLHKARAAESDDLVMKSMSDLSAEQRASASAKKTLENTIVDLSARLDEERREVVDLRRKLANATSDHSQQRLVLRREVDSQKVQIAKIVQESKEKLSDVECRLTEAENRFLESNEQCKKLNVLLQDARAESSDLKIKLGEKENTASSARHKLAQSRRVAAEAEKHHEMKFDELDHRLTKEIEGRKRAVQASREAALERKEMAKSLDAKEAERHAACEELARCEARLKSQISETSQVQELLKAAEALHKDAEERAKVLEGERNEERLKHLKTINRIEVLDTARINAEKRNKVIFEKLGEEQHLLQESEKECRELTKEVIELRAKQLNLKESCEDAVKTAESLRKHERGLHVDCARLKSSKDAAELKLGKAVAELESEMRRVTFCQKRIEELKSDLERASAEKEAESLKRMDAMDMLLEAKQKGQMAQQREEEAEEASLRLREKLEKLETSIAQAAKDLKEKEAARLRSKDALDMSNAKIIDLNLQVANLRQTSETASKELGAGKRRVVDLDRKIEEMQAETERLSSRLIEAEAKAAAADDRMEEALGLYHESTLELEASTKKTAELENRIQELVTEKAKRRASSMSPRRRRSHVDSPAIKELHSVKRALTSLAKQKEREIDQLVEAHRLELQHVHRTSFDDAERLRQKLAQKERESEEAKMLLERLVQQYEKLERERSLSETIRVGESEQH